MRCILALLHQHFVPPCMFRFLVARHLLMLLRLACQSDEVLMIKSFDNAHFSFGLHSTACNALLGVQGVDCCLASAEFAAGWSGTCARNCSGCQVEWGQVTDTLLCDWPTLILFVVSAAVPGADREPGDGDEHAGGPAAAAVHAAGRAAGDAGLNRCRSHMWRGAPQTTQAQASLLSAHRPRLDYG